MSNLEKRALRAGSFVHNNGKVLRTVNILRLKYNKLMGVQSVLEDDGIAEDEFLDSVNFLTEEGYIHLRRMTSCGMMVRISPSCVLLKNRPAAALIFQLPLRSRSRWMTDNAFRLDR